jgi:V8-like Glu-specific endopeptidase
VKIQAAFTGRNGEAVWMMASGWLIKPDLLVTAGHVVYDHGSHLGPATQIKCYIGYNGRDSVTSQSVQTRFGKNVLTTNEWIADSENRRRDLAFIQVGQEFSGNLNLFDFENTPPSGTGVDLGVVGYPGDRFLDTEYGAQMWEQFNTTSYDVGTQNRHMIEYRISTYGGRWESKSL